MFCVLHRVRVNRKLDIWCWWYWYDIFSLFSVFGGVRVTHLFSFMCCVLCLVCPTLQVSLDCPLLMSPSVFSNAYVAAITFTISVVLVAYTWDLLYYMRIDNCCSCGLYILSVFLILLSAMQDICNLY
jgi:hypothetical protein